MDFLELHWAKKAMEIERREVRLLMQTSCRGSHASRKSKVFAYLPNETLGHYFLQNIAYKNTDLMCLFFPRI